MKKKVRIVSLFIIITIAFIYFYTRSPKNNKGENSQLEQLESAKITLSIDSYIAKKTQNVKTEQEIWLKKYIQENWHIKDVIRGDLNSDNYDDLVFISGENGDFRDQEKQEQNLHIYFYEPKSKKYKLIYKEKNHYAVSLGLDNEYYEPLKIENNILYLQKDFWTSMGSWLMWNKTSKYKYTDGKFLLIGKEESETHRATGLWTKISTNYLTNKRKTITSKMFDESPKPDIITWSTIPKEPLHSL